MILVDTSVWIDHFRRGNTRLAGLLESEDVACHPFIVGELACGNLRNRDDVISLLNELPVASPATHEEALTFLAARRLMGRGLGYVDLHLLASAALDHASLWTLDKRLGRIAESLGIGAQR
jgi:predicted nucleic acid-binding protein